MKVKYDKKADVLYILFISILLFFLITSCCKKQNDNYYNFTGNDIDLLIYHQGDTFLFKSNLGKMDTFLCRNSGRTGYEQDQHQTEGFCAQKYSYYYEKAFSEIIKLNADSTVPQNASIKLQKSRNGSVEVNARLEGFLGASVPDYMPKIQIVINGQSYDNVYVFTRDSTTYPFNQSYPEPIKNFYFSKQYGFLRYDNRNGEYWELIR